MPSSSNSEIKIAVYSNLATETFDLSSAFTGKYQKYFIIIFYRPSEPPYAAEFALKERVKVSSEIIWLDDYLTSTIAEASSILLRNKGTIHSFQQLGIGNGKYNFQLIKRNSTAIISFNSVDNLIEIACTSSRKFVFEGHDTRASVQIIYIPLHTQEMHIHGNTIGQKYSCFGKLCFELTKQDKFNLMQPNSPFYLAKNKHDNNSTNKVLPVHYFNRNKYNEMARVFMSLNPYKILDNMKEPELSYLDSSFSEPVMTNFIDDHGSNYYTGNKGLSAQLASVDYQLNSVSEKTYHFIPSDGQSFYLTSKTRGNKFMLLGHSGTEVVRQTRDEGLKCKFKISKHVEANRSTKELELRGNSKTSLCVLTDSIYYSDSELSPMFKNAAQSEYGFLEEGALGNEDPIPLIPTMSFGENNQLTELQDIFSKIRFKKAAGNNKVYHLDESNLITPQGFKKALRRKYKKVAFQNAPDDFIQYDLIHNYREDDSSSSKSKFTFNLIDSKGDLDLSMRQNQVFVVLTPELIRHYGHAEIRALFSINETENEYLRFVLDLSQSYGSANTTYHSESIIICKFHNKSIEELIKNESIDLWTNYGSDLGDRNTLKTIRDEIDLNVKGIKEDYFTQNILLDENWNGVLILNVPLGNTNNLPKIFTGLGSSQRLSDADGNGKIELNSKLSFKYAAFPVNKTKVNGGTSTVEIQSTSFYGLIDYDPFKHDGDYDKLASHFNLMTSDNPNSFRFILSKLRVEFRNSEIFNLESYAFLQFKDLFENGIKFDSLKLANDLNSPSSNIVVKKNNLIRLNGTYQKQENGEDEILFLTKLNGQINFDNGNVLKSLTINKVGFSYDGDDFRFDIDGTAKKEDWTLTEYFSIEQLTFNNIGFTFKLPESELPKITFDLSKLRLLPDIGYDGDGFLSSFPIKFRQFQIFELTKGIADKFSVDFDYYTLPGSIAPKNGTGGEVKFNLFSLVFDLDFGTLGDLDALKALKGQLLIGWTPHGGFVMGFKFAESASSGLNVNLFGAVKLDIEDIVLGSFKPYGEENCSAYFLRLVDARLSIFDVKLPKDNTTFNGVIFSDFSNGVGGKIAWLINLDDNDSGNLLLGLGQRVGPSISNVDRLTTVEAIKKSREVFALDFDNIDPCTASNFSDTIGFKPERNWFAASEDVLGGNWANVIDLKFIFNDPSLYGLYINLKKVQFEIDILYRKMSDNVGVYSTEIVLPPDLRYQEYGGISVTFPNLGLDVSTNGDWRVDLGYPTKTDDWSRSCLLQLLPFVGWGGFYLSYQKTVSQSIFGKYEGELIEGGNRVNLIKAGLAFRIGLGKNYRKGPLYAGASLSIYGSLEGAFAFDEKDSGIDQYLFDHFALRGRIGAIAEIVGYVDFRIVKASLHVKLQVEFGILLVMISGKLKPVPVYIEGSVSVRIRVRIACFKVFGKRYCIHVTFRFSTRVRFNHTLGKGSKSSKYLEEGSKKSIEKVIIPTIQLGALPVIYTPILTKSTEGLHLVHNYSINIFGCGFEDSGQLKFSKNNILLSSILEPLLSTLADSGFNSYDDLASALSEGEDGGNLILKFKFDNIFQLGYDVQEPNDEEFFKDTFLLTPIEFNEFKTLVLNNSESPYRPIPFPITHSLLKVDVNGKGTKELTNGFELKVRNIFSGDDTVSKITRKKDYSQSNIESIDEYFDGYYTHFKEERNVKKLSTENKEFDLREDYVITEYIKLFGLLTLQAGYDRFLKSRNEHLQENQNPKVRMISDKDHVNFGCLEFTTIKENSESEEVKLIKINDVLEEVIGQLNYFYHSGLRLPNFIDEKSETKPYFELLGMTSSDIVLRDDVPDYDSIDIEIDGTSINNPISLKKEMFKDNNDFLPFYKQFRDIADVTEIHLKEEFKITEAGVFTKPYLLKNLTLPIQNSSNRTQSGNRFFPLPTQLRNVAKNQFLDYNLSWIEPTTNLLEETDTAVKERRIDFRACANVEFSVKNIESKTDSKIVEISNVKIDDLDLMNRVKTDNEIVGQLHLYRRGKGDNQNVLEKLGDMVIVKVNLSNRTTPPIIIENRQSKKNIKNERQYTASSKDHPEAFIKLLWEGLTTNNGGYFLLFNESSDVENNLKDYTFVISVLYGDTPAYCNYLYVEDQEIVLDTHKVELYSELDKQRIDLLLTEISTGKSVDNPKMVKEYYATLPAHCVGFSIKRHFKNDTHKQFAPLDFQIAREGITVLSNENVLAIMPTNIDDSLSDDHVVYQHVSPLEVGTKSEDRYSQIGDKYDFKFGLRDIYGFRVVDNLMPENQQYRHQYFDKLMPVSSWPLISSTASFQTIDEKISKWNLILSVSKEEYEKNIQKESIQKELKVLYAQLNDPNSQLVIHVDSGDKINIKDIVKKMVGELIHSNDSVTLPLSLKPDNVTIKYEIQLKEFRTRIHPRIVFSRIADEDHFIDIPKKDIIVLDELAIRMVESPLLLNKLELQKIKNDEGILSGQYTVGIGSDKEGGKALYFLDTDCLNKAFPDSKSIEDGMKFGIKPFSNKLWTGSYGNHEFNNIDLDSSLRLILTKISELLGPLYLNSLYSEGMEENSLLYKLIASKKALSSDGQISLTGKVESISSSESREFDQFNNLLSEDLLNYYRYDGLLLQERPNVPELKNHRISVSFDVTMKAEEVAKEYGVVSSKLHFTGEDQVPWTTIFDNKSNNMDPKNSTPINFSMSPSITHIEYDVELAEDEDEVQASNWIQLLLPYKPKKIYKVSFPPIVRVFPSKPKISLVEWGQENPDVFEKWSEHVGAWEFLLGIEDENNRAYVAGDQLTIKLARKSANKSSKGTVSSDEEFNGFIAHWANEISNNRIKEHAFITELYDLVSIQKKKTPKSIPEDNNYDLFILQKAQNDGWELKEINQNNKFSLKGGSIGPDGNKLYHVNRLVFTGANIFKKDYDVVSVLPHLSIARNVNGIDNSSFHYQTDIVTPSSWTTPMIYLKKAKFIENIGSFRHEVFRLISRLPFKANAKYLFNTGNESEIEKWPIRPIKLVQFDNGFEESNDPDDEFNNYVNGCPCYSVTIFNKEDESNLPIMKIETIFKKQ